MSDFLSTFTNIFSNYGVKTFLIVFITIILINLIKKPITKKAEQYAVENNCDKSIITCYITYVAIIIPFIVNLLYELCITNFNFYVIDWSNYVYSSLTYGAIAIATYESIKKQVEAYVSKKQLTNNSKNSNEDTISTSETTNIAKDDTTKKVL